jgi:hypothetical protein
MTWCYGRRGGEALAVDVPAAEDEVLIAGEAGDGDVRRAAAGHRFAPRRISSTGDAVVATAPPIPTTATPTRRRLDPFTIAIHP